MEVKDEAKAESLNPTEKTQSQNKPREELSEPVLDKRTERLVGLMRETGKALTERQLPPTEDERIADRFRAGHLLQDPNRGLELLGIFLMLSEAEQQKFWENVEAENEWEAYLTGGPTPKHWHRAAKKPPLMRPQDVSRGDVLSLEEALRRLGRVRVKDNEWRALCPAHDNHHRLSLVISESEFKPGEPVFYCYAGCTHQQVKDALMERL